MCKKRLGTRLRNLLKQYKGTQKPLSGKGKLTEKVINSMQNYYGLAISQNSNNDNLNSDEKRYAIKKAVGAILYHSTNFSNVEKRHGFCPRTENTWCKYQSDKITGKLTYKERINLPEWMYDKLTPIFQSLSKDVPWTNAEFK